VADQQVPQRKPLSLITVGWIIWALTFGVLELSALLNKAPGDTLSEILRRLFRLKRQPRPPRLVTILLRSSLALFLIWLFTHLFWEWPW
jgi:hypothetical protein